MANGLKRNVAVAIGISAAEGLPYLGGALNGARQFEAWARGIGYETKLILDEDAAVTIEIVRDTITGILPPNGGPVGRFILYFAGHGQIREAEEGQWLLSRWKSERRAIGIEALKRRLSYFDIEQVAIFADSCRSLPSSMITFDLTSDAVLGAGPLDGTTVPEINKFIAAPDGGTTFVVPAEDPKDDRCLFSGILMEALWGTRPEAFSQSSKTRITSASLGTFLKKTIPVLSAKYKRKFTPDYIGNFSEGSDIYFATDSVPAPPRAPVFPPWPDQLQTVVPQAAPRSAKTEATDIAGRIEIGLRFGDQVNLSSDLTHFAFYARGVDVSRLANILKKQKDRTGRTLLQHIRGRSLPDSFETEAGFAVQGGPIECLWTPKDIFAGNPREPNWWHVGGKNASLLKRPVPLLIAFEDGRFVAPCALPRFIAQVVCDEVGASALVYRKIHNTRGSPSSEEAIAQLESGRLRAGAATDLAVKLRLSKHDDPVLGLISAYLYDSIDDIDSIRQMAFFYVQEGQPIPYDIALLGRLRGRMDQDGVLVADVPQTQGRKPRTASEKQYAWTFRPTPATHGRIGGLWPWMRQGWALLAKPARDGSTLVLPQAMELTEHLTAARFSTFDRKGGRVIVKRFGFVQRLPEAPAKKPAVPKRKTPNRPATKPKLRAKPKR